MATDGPKIIDGDIAFETYWGIMDLYDSDVDIETIKTEIPFVRRNYGIHDDFHYEVFVTSYALAFWEIGAMNNEILNEVRSVIEKGACVKDWAKDNQKAAKTRQKELDKLWKKISHPNTNIRKKKKYREVSKLLFNQNDLLCFQLPNKNYCVTSILEIDQYKGSCRYEFSTITYNSLQKPSYQKILPEYILGRYDHIRKGIETIIIENLSNFIKKKAEAPERYFISLKKTAIEHKYLRLFADKFEKVGELFINKAHIEHSCEYSYLEKFDVFCNSFEGDLNNSEFNKIPIQYLISG